MHDFVAIGDTVLDEFIKLEAESGASIVGKPDTSDYKICLPFAEKVPYAEALVLPAVGNAANAAVCASHLGLKSALVSNIGDDENGRRCLASLKADGVDTSNVKIHKGARTNYHYVLWFPPDRTILIKHEEYEYALPEINSPKWLYFSSVNEKAYPFHEKVADYLDKNSEVKFALQPGKFEIKLGKDKLSRLYRRADIFFCNVEEAGKILGMNTLGMSELLKRIHEVGPKVVVITDGPKGAYSYDGSEMLFHPPYPQELAYERTGAGDAFASTVVSALALGHDLKTALAWGSINAYSVVQKVGAQAGLLSRAEIEEYLSKAPSDFQAREFSSL